jgi:molybdate transport system permease protein
MDISPLWISLKVALLATFIAFFAGIYAARLVVKLKRCRGLLDSLFTLPLVLPPTVVGFFLLLIFGKNGMLGQILGYFDVSVVFSWVGAVIASTVVSFPLMYRTARGAFEQIDLNLIFAARTIGMSENSIFWKIVIPLSWPGIIAGGILAFARALGEFGATIMLAGNIPGRTRTMSVAVYSAVQAGDRELAFRWVAVIMAISVAVILLMNYWSTYQNRLPAKWRDRNAKG